MKAAKRIGSFLLALVLVVSLVPPVHTHAAYEGIPIRTKANLAAISDNLAGQYYLDNDIVFTEADFAPGGDFYNDGKLWLPISGTFTGLLDGNGYEIQGLQINSSNAMTGLFAVNAGTIRNLELTGGSIAVNYTLPYGEVYVGSIAAKNTGTIENCINRNTITVKTLTDYADGRTIHVGGIAGEQTTGGIIRGCGNTGAITTESMWADVGGIVGYSYGSSTVVYVNNCYNAGAIDMFVSFDGNAGGIVAYNHSMSQIANCANSGKVTARCVGTSEKVAQGVLAGGIAGQNRSAILRSYNTGAITTDSDATWSTYQSFCASRCAGIAAYCSANATVEDCYNTGSITAVQNQDYFWSQVAGIVTVNASPNVKNCYNTGILTNSGKGKKESGQIMSVAADNSSGAYSNCYYLDTVTSGEKLTAQDMTKAESFPGFDFSSRWTMESANGYTFPRLQNTPKMGYNKQLVSLSVLEKPAKRKYQVGDSLDLTGGKLLAGYNTGYEMLDMTAEGVTVSGFSTSAASSYKTAYVYYGGESDSFTYSVCSGHEWSEADCENPRECTLCGATEGEPVHSWTPADCDTAKTCSLCGVTEGDALGHSWVDATCVLPKTCSVCGETEGEADSDAHEWADATCKAPKKCTLCGATEGEIAEDAHDMENGVCKLCGLQTGTCGENAYWKLKGGVLTVYGSGEMTSAPWPKVSITTVIIEEGITSICESAFKDCEKLTAVAISNTVTKLGSSCFDGGETLASVDLPEGITSIPSSAFAYCWALTGIRIPESVTSIGYKAFAYCREMVGMQIPEKVTSIGGDAFTGCSKLKFVRFNGNAPTLGSYAFRSLTLKAFYPGYDTTWTSDVRKPYGGSVTWVAYDQNHMEHSFDSNGVCSCGCIGGTCGQNAQWALDPATGTLYISGTGKMEDFYSSSQTPWANYKDAVHKVVVEEGITHVGGCAFKEFSNLEHVSLPDSLTSIGSEAIMLCKKLKEIEIPSKVTQIGAYAFEQCYGLESVVLPEGLSTINSGLFNLCTSLKTVTIPAAVTAIGTSAFNGCNSLTDVYYGSSEKAWQKIEIGSYNTALDRATIHYTDPCAMGHPLMRTFEYEGDRTIIGLCGVCYEELGRVTLSTPDGKCDGTTAYTAAVEGEIPGAEYTLTYCCAGGCMTPGDHTAYLKVGNCQVESGFHLESSQLTVISVTAQDRVYDGTDAVTITGVELSGVPEDADVAVDLAALMAYLPVYTAGNQTKVTLLEVRLTGADAENYTIENRFDDVPITGGVTITPRPLTLKASDQELIVGGQIDQWAFEVTEGGVAWSDAVNSVEISGDTSRVTDSGVLSIGNAQIINEWTDVTSSYEITYLPGVLTVCCDSHDWTPADCVTAKTCKVCGDTEGEALGHSWVDADCATPKTCTVCGETEGEALGHAYERGICSRCDAVHSNLAGYSGKTISILGDSISTFAGVSNDPNASTAIQNNATFYNGSVLGVGLADTWWQQTVDALDLELLVNNSWSGSCIYTTRAGTPGAYVARCEQLHNNEGTVPDIIAIYLGTNDYYNFKSTLGSTGAIDYAQLIRETADGYTYAEPTTAMEAYAIMLHKMTKRYPMAEIYCFTLLPMRNLSAADQLLLEQFNDGIKELADHFHVNVVDLYTDSGIKTDEHFQDYIADNSVHPGPLGMDAITDVFVDALLEQGAPASHTHSYEGVVTPPTCTEQGYTTYICTACGGSYVADRVPAKDHDWQDADCETAKTCKVCGETEGEALGHSWVDADCDTAKTCSVCGETEGEALGHDWVDADCVNPKTCKVCGETEGVALGHDWVDADCETAKTCSVCGETEGEALGHSKADGVCTNCGIGLNLSDYLYTLDEAAMTVTLTDYIGNGSGVHVAETYLLEGKEYRTLLEATSVFRGNTAITSVTIDDGVTIASDSMAEMFYGCSALKTADLAGLDTAGVTSLRRVFSECKKLVSVDVTGWDTSAVEDMSYLFDYCNALTTITGYENWNTGSVWNINKAFNRTTSIDKVDLSKWNLSQVTNSGWCFQMCYAEEILLPDNLAVMSAGFFNHPAYFVGSTFTIPSGVKKIGYAHTIYDFGTDDFSEFIVPEANGYYQAVDGILYSEDGTELIAIPRGKTFENGVFEVPNTVTFMGELSFSRNYNIETLVLPDNFIIEYVPLYDSRYIIEDGHGGNDTGNLNSGTNLSIAIYCYTGITAYDVRETNTRYEAVEGVIYSEDMTTLVAVPARYAQNLNIPEGVTTWNKEAMWADHAGNSNLLSLLENCTGVSIPSTLTEIDAEQLSMINSLAERISSAFTITVAEGNRTFHVDPVTGHLATHSYSQAVTDPTCQDQGYTTYTCAACGDSYATDHVPARGHNWADADCETAKTCKVCGATEGTATGHAWIEATCYNLKTCNNCGITVGELLPHDWAPADCVNPKQCKNCSATEGSALGHDWAAADCQNPKTCDRCGKTEGAVTGHSWVGPTCYAPKTCSVCGAIDSVTWGHNWMNATCTAPETCSICGETRGEAIGHAWSGATCTEVDTCVICGATQGEVLGHDWTPADCDTAKTCKVCGTTEGDPLGHTVVTDKAVDATCTETGLTEGKHCSVCGTVTKAQQVIPVKGHNEVVDKAVDATCTATGLTEGKHCSVCGTVTKAQQVIPAKEHSEVIDKAVDATCTTAGKTEGSHCSVCGKVLKEQDKIPAMGHTPVVDGAVEPSCTETGLTAGAHCVVCDAVLKAQETVPAKGHTEVKDAAVAATCTTAGKTEGKHCSVCGEVIVAQQTVSATGHNWKDATCTSAKTCKTCGATSGNALGHSWKNATCSEPKTCKTCGATSGYALGHDWTAGNCYAPKTCKVCGVKDGGVVHAFAHQYDYKCDVCGVERTVDMTRPMMNMYRMYNPNTGEHFYTGSEVERDNLIAVGWQYEGVGFTFPLTTGKPVYRLFQPSTGEHLYTMDENEKAALMAAGWNYEGIAFNSGFENEVPQYRLHNPNAIVGAYHFTASEEEKDNLIAAGWEYQGIGWYSMGA